VAWAEVHRKANKSSGTRSWRMHGIVAQEQRNGNDHMAPGQPDFLAGFSRYEQ
jgi:hypothetical protein